MFDELLARIESRLDVPYPERTLLIAELRSDLLAVYSAARKRGRNEAEAVEEARRLLGFDEDALLSMSLVHQPAIRRAIERLPREARDGAEALFSTVPLVAAFVFTSKEVPMLQFIQEGGMVSWLVVLIGGLGLLLELRRTFIWFVLRDHRPEALRRNTPIPLYLAAAALAVGVMGTGLGLYVVLGLWADGRLGPEVLRVALREPLACLVLGSAFAALIVLSHGALDAALRAQGVPRVAPSAQP